MYLNNILTAQSRTVTIDNIHFYASKILIRVKKYTAEQISPIINISLK